MGIADEMAGAEPALEPERPIIDPHMHNWDIPTGSPLPHVGQRFLVDESAAVIAQSGHAITHTVFIECGQMYRGDGLDELRSVGETEFANGVAAMAASGQFGPCHIAHRIVATVDLLLGAGVARVLEAHRAAAPERLRGVRMGTVHSDAGLFGYPPSPDGAGVMRSAAFIEGARALAAADLSLDIWCMHTQIGDVIALADAVPDLSIILDHIATPETQGRYAGRGDQAYSEWLAGMRELAQRPNVVVKIGGMGMELTGIMGTRRRGLHSEVLVERWRPFVEPCIEAFTPHRAMFESNFPPDNDQAGYGAIWNAFKVLARLASEDEKDLLFRGTAARIYGIQL